MTGRERVSHFFSEESGQDLIEYALIGAFLGFGAVAMLKNITANIGTVFGAVGSTLTSAV